MTGPKKQTRARVILRDQGCCVRCGREVMNPDTGDLFDQYSIHHRAPRGMGGSRDPRVNGMANLILLCGSGTTGCHGWVETSRKDARDRGFLVSQHTDPWHVPVLHSYRGWVWVDDTYTPLDEAERWDLARAWLEDNPSADLIAAAVLFRLPDPGVCEHGRHGSHIGACDADAQLGSDFCDIHGGAA